MGACALVLIFIASIFGCTTTPQIVSPEKIYRRDMVVEVNGREGDGVLVVPRSNEYKFKIESRGTLDMLIIKSCHEHKPVENAKEKGWFGSKRRTRFTYIMGDVELNRSACPLEIGGFEKDKGRHSWALVDFESPDYKLPATLYCNGQTSEVNGVSICQSQGGLIQRIKFPSDIEMATTTTKCKIQLPVGNHLEWNIRPGICVYNFIEINEPHRFHRMTTIGYEEILVRGEPN